MPYKDPEKRRRANRKYYLEHKEQHQESVKKWDDAHKEERRLYAQRYYQQNRERILLKNNAYNAAHRDVLKIKYAVYRVANLQDIRRRQVIYNKRFRQSAKYTMYLATNREGILRKRQIYHALYYLLNRSRILTQTKHYARTHPEQTRQRGQSWRRANPDKAAAMKHRRRARQQSVPATMTHAEWQAALEYFGYACAACGEPASLFTMLVQDHWIPFAHPASLGHVRDNVVPLCHAMRADGRPSCNLSKNDRDPQEWLTSRFGARKAKAILKRIEAYLQSLRPHDIS